MWKAVHKLSYLFSYDSADYTIWTMRDCTTEHHDYPTLPYESCLPTMINDYAGLSVANSVPNQHISNRKYSISYYYAPQDRRT